MRSVLSSVAVAFILISPPTGEAAAQIWESGPPGEDIASLNLVAGALAPQTKYSDGSSLATGTAFGVVGTYWPFRYLGIGASVVRAKNEADVSGALFDFSALAGQDPTVWLWGAHATLRYPLVSQSFSWFPYIGGGPLLKAYHWAIYEPQQGGLFGRPYGGSRNTSFGWSYGGGIEIRFGSSGMFGIVGDARTIQSDFDWFGLRTSQSDWLFTAGITITR